MLRIGGTLQDSVIYDFESSEKHCEPFPFQPDDNERTGFTQECFSSTRRREIQEFLKKSNLKFIFGLNALQGRNDDFSKPWDSEKTKALLKEFKTTKMAERLFGLELGNEIYGRNGHNVELSAKIAAGDFAALRKIMKANLSEDVKLLGYDTALDFNWLVDFFSNLTSLETKLDAFTWHQYPLGPGSYPNLVEKIMNPRYFDKFSGHIDVLQEKRAFWKGHESIPLWMGETGGAYNSGRNEVTNRFVSSFWYLNLLGIFAEKKHKAFCRQTLIGGNYGLLQLKGDNIETNPDFWVAFLFASLMKDLVIEIFCANDLFKCYATRQQRSITILVINYSEKQEIGELSDDLFYAYSYRKTAIVSSDKLDSKIIFINGIKISLPKGKLFNIKKIELISDSNEIPSINDFLVYEKNHKTIDLPAHSYGFFVLHGLK